VGKWILRLYPRSWRERYEEEVAAVLDQHGCPPRTLVNLVLGALDARLVLPRFREENLVPVNGPAYRVARPARLGGVAVSTAIAALSLSFVLLLAYAMFIGFPDITQTGDANLERWVGPDWARWGYLALGLVMAGAYVMVAIAGNRDAGEPRSRAVLIGAAAGAMAGLVAIAVLALVTATARHPAQMGPGSTVPMFLLVVAPAGAGVWVGLLTRRAGHGLLAGFWCAVVFALLISVALLLRDMVFAGLLEHTAWLGDRVGDPTCNNVHGATLAGCEIGDDFGFAASLLLLGPLLGAVVGWGGSAIASVGRRPAETAGRRWTASTGAIMAFCAVLLGLFVVEVLTKLW